MLQLFLGAKPALTLHPAQRQLSDNMKNVPQLVWFAAGTLFLVSCSPVYSPLNKTPGAMYKKGVVGGTVIDSYQLTGTVTAIDVSARTLSLVAKAVQTATVKCNSTDAQLDHHQLGVMDSAN